MTLLPPGPPLDPGRNARRLTIALILVSLAMNVVSTVDRRQLHAENELSKVQRRENRGRIDALEARVARLESPPRGE